MSSLPDAPLRDCRPAWAGDIAPGPAAVGAAAQTPTDTTIPADIADVPALDLTADGNGRMRYFLIGPRKDAVPPQRGFKLVVVMPGGDGGEGFHPFVRRLDKQAMTGEFLVAQPVAVRWTPSQRTVWPTRIHPEPDQAFSTEDFVEAVIKDVRAERRCESPAGHL